MPTTVTARVATGSVPESVEGRRPSSVPTGEVLGFELGAFLTVGSSVALKLLGPETPADLDQPEVEPTEAHPQQDEDAAPAHEATSVTTRPMRTAAAR